MQVVDSIETARVHRVLHCILDRGQDLLGRGAGTMVAIEDPAHAQMAASMSVVQMAVQWLLNDLRAAHSVGLSIPQACILLRQPGLYSTQHLLNYLEKLFSGQRGEVDSINRSSRSFYLVLKH
jgi:hypothetical protein